MVKSNGFPEAIEKVLEGQSKKDDSTMFARRCQRHDDRLQTGCKMFSVCEKLRV